MWIMVDVETDGPCWGIHSMVSFAMMVVDQKMNKSLKCDLQPMFDKYDEEVLKRIHLTRAETMTYPKPSIALKTMDEWLKDLQLNAKSSKKQLRFISDNNGFDWGWIHYYFHYFLGYNPFGFSSQNLGSLFKGNVHDMFRSFKYLRKTKHDHNPLNDVKGNVEAMLAMAELFNIKGLSLKG